MFLPHLGAQNVAVLSAGLCPHMVTPCLSRGPDSGCRADQCSVLWSRSVNVFVLHHRMFIVYCVSPNLHVSIRVSPRFALMLLSLLLPPPPPPPLNPSHCDITLCSPSLILLSHFFPTPFHPTALSIFSSPHLSLSILSSFLRVLDSRVFSSLCSSPVAPLLPYAI